MIVVTVSPLLLRLVLAACCAHVARRLLLDHLDLVVGHGIGIGGRIAIII